MAEKSILAAGFIPIAIGKIYFPSQNQIAKITNIAITPKDFLQAYTISLYKVIPGTTTPVLLFSYSLSAGDSISCDNEYWLGAGDSIQAVCSIENYVNYVIDGIEQLSNSFLFGVNKNQ